ncbi:hypothetical protein CWM66_26390 [Kosakonia sp. H7A]|uniref:head-tail connector protein n=1 Tax=Kosakonia sp. H7A TaxID=2054598 RepID=UPI000D1636C4|nr:head-tail connector protein [Kosakonia sp. H7A]PTA87460.1 hypothetical protein CWM66_26390 [Kosakonia sp. H7A]
MEFIELSVVRKHCRIDDDFTGDDDLLEIFKGAAVRYVETWTRRKLYKDNTEPGFADDPDSLLLDDDIRTAMLLLIGHWYANREAVNISNITSEIPLATEALLQPHRIYGL